MRDVLVVLFWLWVVVSLGVYGFRLYRRVTRGKGDEAATGAADQETTTSSAGGLGRLGRRSEPPLPEGPLEPRLPKSLQGPAPGAAATPPVPSEPTGGPAADRADAAPAPAPAALPTVADALAGIRLPDGWLPFVEPGDVEASSGRVARFSATGSSVQEVAGELRAELERLGYAVDGPGALTAEGVRLRATRDATVVTGSVADDEGRVLVDLRV